MFVEDDRGPVWAEIDLGHIVHNFQVVRSLIHPGAGIMAVVKADAYGHGAVQVARALDAAGAEAFGVARAGEGIVLRDAGLKKPILILGYTPPALVPDLIAHDLSQTVFSEPYAASLEERAATFGGRLGVHLKIDTGMGRLGLLPRIVGDGDDVRIDPDSIVVPAMAMARCPHLDMEGLFTHFAASDSADKSSARRQLAIFQAVISCLDAAGLRIPLKHACNSAAVIDMPEANLDMVRAGIMLYGLYPSDEVSREKAGLRPAMQLKARVAHVKSVPRGFKVSYGHTYTTPCPTRIATIPIGYADGYDRRLSSAGCMLVHGQRAPIVGRVCMDQTMIDVGGIDGVQVGDEVVVIGRQGAESYSADEMARQLGTINYEIVSTVMARVPRVYLNAPGRKAERNET